MRRYIKEGKLKAVKIAGNIRVAKTVLDQFSSSEVQLTAAGPKKSASILTREHFFSLDDPIFRIKGRGSSLKAI